MPDQPTYDSIIIAGERRKLAGGVKVVTFEDTGGYSFERDSAAAEQPLFGYRKTKEGRVKTYEQLKEVVQQVVLHADITRDSDMCYKVLAGRSLSTHFMIDWDGVIYQPLDVLYEAYQAGDVNNTSIGVDLNNLLPNLVRNPNAPPYDPKHPRIGEMSEKEFRRPVSKRMEIQTGMVKSYGYTDAQYLALVELLKALIKWLPRIKPFPPVDAKGEVWNRVIEDYAGFEGYMAHWHISTDRWDPGPGFDWERVTSALSLEHNAFPIELEKNKNIGSLLLKHKVLEYAQRYYSNNETRGNGGWYPIGLNQTWHGGIHLATKEGDPVKAMFNGVVVAARFAKCPSRMGNNNFLVLRHEVELPGAPQKDRKGKTKPAKKKPFVFYSLYMHLGPLDAKTITDDSPEWLKQVFLYGREEEEAEEEALEGDAPGQDDEEEEDEFADDEDDFWDDEDDDDCVDKREYLQIKRGRSALEEGKIFLPPWEGEDADPIRVSSGEVIGTVGRFGKPDEQMPQIHVEVFGDKVGEKSWKEAIDLSVHGRFFVEIEADPAHSDLFVRDRDILSLFDASVSAPSLVPARTVSPADIEDFWTYEGEYEAEKRWLRKLVTRHVSEWSDKVDWVAALSNAEDWKAKTKDFHKIIKQSGVFRSAFEELLPFIWLNQEVAEHIGLQVEEPVWNGVIYHFHPIHFLIWLTYNSAQRIQKVSRGLTYKELKEQRKVEAKAKKEAAARGERQAERGDDMAAAFDLDEVDPVEADDALKDWLGAHDEGDWFISGDEE